MGRTTYSDIKYNCTRCQRPQKMHMVGGDPLWFCAHRECDRYGVMTIMADEQSRNDFIQRAMPVTSGIGAEDKEYTAKRMVEPTRPVKFTISFASVSQSELQKFMGAVIGLANIAGAQGCQVEELP
jgi:hypothetical protein